MMLIKLEQMGQSLRHRLLRSQSANDANQLDINSELAELVEKLDKGKLDLHHQLIQENTLLKQNLSVNFKLHIQTCSNIKV